MIIIIIIIIKDDNNASHLYCYAIPNFQSKVKGVP